ncbi:MAG: nucleotidyltransferase domain-containing protein [Acidobacteriota bacterium]
MSELAVHPPLEPGAVRDAIASRTAEVDRCVLEAFAEFLEAKHSAGLALVAVGGYGRKDLFPYSDVDLLFLVDSDASTPPRGVILAFLQRLWDWPLRPAHSVHSLADCAVEHPDNTEFTISLLDHRFMAGDQSLYGQFDQKFAQFRVRRGQAVAKKLVILAEERRSKFQNTIYQLEPNLKEAPGGLRDLQTARWLHALDPHGTLPDLSGPADFLSGIRWRLHQAAKRDQNGLTFEMQDSLSERPEALMRDYFRHARTVDRATRFAMEASTERSGELLRRFHEWRSRLSTADFTVSRDRVLLRGHKPPGRIAALRILRSSRLEAGGGHCGAPAGFCSGSELGRLEEIPEPAETRGGVCARCRNPECLRRPCRSGRKLNAW